jgi:hypothetical protein
MGKGALATYPPFVVDHASQWWARCRFAHPTDNGLQTDLLRAQAQSRRTTATNQHDGQISQNLSSHSRKNIPLNLSGKSAA